MFNIVKIGLISIFRVILDMRKGRFYPGLELEPGFLDLYAGVLPLSHEKFGSEHLFTALKQSIIMHIVISLTLAVRNKVSIFKGYVYCDATAL